MKSWLTVGNWKSHKSTAEATDWLAKFAALQPAQKMLQTKSKMVLCVPFTILSTVGGYIRAHNLPLVLGAQDVSAFPDGSHTGQISGRMLKELADWVIIGHSESRRELGESDAILSQKVGQAKAVGLRVIYCVSGSEMAVPPQADVVAYEPLDAIGTGRPDELSNAEQIISRLKAVSGVKIGIYGGSVTAGNIKLFRSSPGIDGVLVGNASLDPEGFSRLIDF